MTSRIFWLKLLRQAKKILPREGLEMPEPIIQMSSMTLLKQPIIDTIEATTAFLTHEQHHRLIAIIIKI